MVLVSLIFLFGFLFGSGEGEPCIELAEYARKMADFPVEGVDLYRHTDHQRVAKIEKLDLTAEPPVFSVSGIEGGQPLLKDFCVRRSDLEERVVYRISILEHDYDGLACVSFEEGMAHGKSFQLPPHNKSREIRLYGYRRAGSQWMALAPRTGFSEEAFVFNCGVRTGPVPLIAILESGQIRDGQILLTPTHPLANSPEFTRDGEIRFREKTYLRGAGFTDLNP